VLYVKNGRIQSDSCSFALPEDWYFFYYSGVEVRDGFEFSKEEDSESVRLNVGIQDVIPQATLEAIDAESEYVSTSEIFPVSRGGLTGKAMFYRSLSGRREYYEEHLELKSGQILEIFLACDVTGESRGKIKELLEERSVTEFLSSIQAK